MLGKFIATKSAPYIFIELQIKINFVEIKARAAVLKLLINSCHYNNNTFLKINSVYWTPLSRNRQKSLGEPQKNYFKKDLKKYFKNPTEISGGENVIGQFIRDSDT